MINHSWHRKARRPVLVVFTVGALLVAGCSASQSQNSVSPPEVSRSAADTPATAPGSAHPAVPWVEQASLKYAKARVVRAKLRKGQALKPKIMNASPNGSGQLGAVPDPYVDTSSISQAQACSTQAADAAALQRDADNFYVQSDSTTYKLPVDAGAFCKITVSRQPKIITGLNQRIYYTTGPAGTPAKTIAYAFDNKDQTYTLSDVNSGTLYLRAVPAADVLASSFQCRACDFRAATLRGGYNYINADISGSDFSGATLFNVGFGDGVNLTNSLFGSYQGQDVVMVDVDFTDADLSGVTFEGVTLDETVVLDKAKRDQKNIAITSSVVEYPKFGMPKITYISDVFMVTPDTAGRMTKQTFKDIQILSSTFVGSPPDFSQTIWSNVDLSGSDFSNLAFYSANFSDRVTANGTRFTGSKLTAASQGPPVNFAGAQLHEADFSRTLLLNASFKGAKLGADSTQRYGAATFEHASAQGANFDGIDGGGVNFNNAYLTRGTKPVDFNSANLNNAQFNSALIGAGVFTGADLTNASMYRTQCISCDVTTATLVNVNLTQSYLFGTDLSNAIKLDGSDLRGSDCCSEVTSPTAWTWITGTGATLTSETYEATDLSAAKFGQIGTCPSGNKVSSASDATKGPCDGQESPRKGEGPPDPPTCVAAASYLCSNTIALVAGNGKDGYSAETSDGTVIRPTDAKFSAPSRVVVNEYAPDSTDPETLKSRLLIADTGNNVVRTISLPTAVDGGVSVFAGQPNKTGVDDGKQANQALLNKPTGLAVDPFGRVYIADTGNNRIRRIDADGYITTIAGGSPSGNTGDGSGAIKAKLNGPKGVAVSCSTTNPGDCVVYVADTGNNRVRQIRNNGRIYNFAGSSSGTPTAADKSNKGDTKPATSATLNQPTSVTLDNRGNVYVADSGNNLVRYVVGSTGVIYSYNGGTMYKGVEDVQTDSANFLYLAQSDATTNVIRRTDTTTGHDVPGVIAGTGPAGYSGDNRDATAAMLYGPQGMFPATPWGPYYIADTGNNRIRVVSPNS